ncbi:hypothetical protein [Collimonas fungivorans]|uniref:hypothetical protein n=1 Tax=Collimonas fungivorans TaxID=158899 RepID=UPI0012372917|nr:hypothetical protein [Collimonas fungivorans]
MAKRHGWHQYLLHDDFYGENGEADQPDEDVEHPEQYPAPALESISHDPELLLDFSITRWNYSIELETAWNMLPKSAVLAAIQSRFETSRNMGVRDRILEICASNLKDHGAEFVRAAWEFYPHDLALPCLAEATASCLPFREGYDRVVSELARLEGNARRNVIFVMGYFRSIETLDWIETNICEPTTDSWGYLAAVSGIDWIRLQTWLDAGRPLSLVAIDALGAFQRRQTHMLKKFRSHLVSLPSKEELKSVLDAYARRDNVPRVLQRIDSVLEKYELLSWK